MGRSIGLAAGGKIEQNIYIDSNPVSLYDEESVVRLWVHTLSSEGWEVNCFQLITFTNAHIHLSF